MSSGKWRPFCPGLNVLGGRQLPWMNFRIDSLNGESNGDMDRLINLVLL